MELQLLPVGSRDLQDESIGWQMEVLEMLCWSIHAFPSLCLCIVRPQETLIGGVCTYKRVSRRHFGPFWRSGCRRWLASEWLSVTIYYCGIESGHRNIKERLGEEIRHFG